MTRYEYKVCPAPSKGRKASGVKGPEARFAHSLELLMNDMGAEGWEYQRSDILPSEERQGLASTHTVYRSVLVFRRAIDDTPPETQPETQPEALSPPEPTPALIEAEQSAPLNDADEPVQETPESSDNDEPRTIDADDTPRPV